MGIEPTTKKLLMHGAVRLHNSGGTPAYNLTVKIAAKIADRYAIPFTEIGAIHDEYGPSIMGPGTDYEIGAWADYNPQDMLQLEAGLKKTFIWGRVDYDDAFGTHRWFEFREVSANAHLRAIAVKRGRSCVFNTSQAAGKRILIYH